MSDQYILRRATANDAAALSHIAFMTGDAGKSAGAIYTNTSLVGLVYAEPYVHMPSAFAFLLVSTTETGSTTETIPRKGKGDTDLSSERAVGYIIGAFDTRQFEAELEEKWWPDLRRKYPVSMIASICPNPSLQTLHMAIPPAITAFLCSGCNSLH